ncbi:MAG: chemotaxis protein CheA [Marinagarivorans sp.]
MTPLLEQFLSESRDFLQSIGDLVLQLERSPQDTVLLNDLFRAVHTLKGNSGLFEFPDMTRVLHAGEDVLVAVREHELDYSQALADCLLEAMDFIVLLCDQVAKTGSLGSEYMLSANQHVQQLRGFLTPSAQPESAPANAGLGALSSLFSEAPFNFSTRCKMWMHLQTAPEHSLYWVRYTPVEDCFFQGDDPLLICAQIPGVLARVIRALRPWPNLAELDAFQSQLEYQVVSSAPQAQLVEHLHFVPNQFHLQAISQADCVQVELNALTAEEQLALIAVYHSLVKERSCANLALVWQPRFNSAAWAACWGWLDFWCSYAKGDAAVVAQYLAQACGIEPAAAAQTAPPLGLESAQFNRETICEEDQAALLSLLARQRIILYLTDQPAWRQGRLNAVVSVLRQCCKALGFSDAIASLNQAAQDGVAALQDWLEAFVNQVQTLDVPAAKETVLAAPLEHTIPQANTAEPSAINSALVRDIPSPGQELNSYLQELSSPRQEFSSPRQEHDNPPQEINSPAPEINNPTPDANSPAAATLGLKRGDETPGLGKSIKVDQAKIDRLMNLIGELIVAKNALPYLASRAEEGMGVRELAREIKSHHGVVNRIADEMQDAIMQIRMMPFSTISARYPRLVRDIARKLAKDVQFLVEGEETEADKNIIESLADPLVHILRNSLDHGIELPEERTRLGKSPQACLRLRASQEADRVVIDVSDDGRGIDPEKIKRKAYEKGLIDETLLERMSERDAIQLIFAAGFSTAETVSDLSGRGVGMDVVRSAVERVNGSISIDSQVGKGTHIRISLPLSMAVTRVMLVEADRQLFAVPMDEVVETVRVPRSQIHTLKQHQTTLLRGRIVPLAQVHQLLALTAEACFNEDDECAVLVVRVGDHVLGLVVDDFHGTEDIIQKPLAGVLANLRGFSGSALLGDGSVLMVLNIKELL